jgi:hypothetical protein
VTQIVHVLPVIEIHRNAKALPAKRPRGGTTTIPDSVVLDVRRMHEIDRKTTQQVLVAFPQYSRTWVLHILAYMIRTRLRVR